MKCSLCGCETNTFDYINTKSNVYLCSPECMADYKLKSHISSGNRIASVLTRKGSDTIIATAPDFWETLTEFIKELHKLNKKTVKISDFEILTVGNYIERYPKSEFSKNVKQRWNQKECDRNEMQT